MSASRRSIVATRRVMLSSCGWSWRFSQSPRQSLGRPRSCALYGDLLQGSSLANDAQSFDDYRDGTTAVNTTSSTSDTLSKAADINAAPKNQGLDVATLEQAMGVATVGNPAPHEKRRGYRDTMGLVKSIETGFEGDGPIRIRSVPREGFSDNFIRTFSPSDTKYAPRKDRRALFAHALYDPPSDSTSDSPHTPPSTPPSSPVADSASSLPSSSTSSPPPVLPQEKECNTQLDVGNNGSSHLTTHPPATQDASPKSAPTETEADKVEKHDDSPPSLSDILKLAKDIPLPSHNEHSGLGMNAEHNALD